MRLRVGFILGFVAGYYFGTMAGRERYEQINQAIQRAKQSDALDIATGKARAVVDLGKERARDLRNARHTNGAASPATAQN